MRRRSSSAAAYLGGSAAVSGFAAVPTSARTAKPAAVLASRVTVVAREFRFTLSKRTVPVGQVVFTVVNKGKLAHDFKIAGKKTPLIRPGKKATFRVVFRKKGRYKYLCTVPGHAAAGMKGTLTVGA